MGSYNKYISPAKDAPPPVELFMHCMKGIIAMLKIQKKIDESKNVYFLSNIIDRKIMDIAA